MGWQNYVFNIVIVEGSNGGIFVYDGTPAFGTLIASIAAPAVTEDQFGNFVQGGTFAVYGEGNIAPFAYLGATAGPGGFPALAMLTDRPMEMTGSFLYNFVINEGLSSEELALTLEGPQANHPSDDFISVQLFSSSEDGTQSAQGELSYFGRSAAGEFDQLLWGIGGLFMNYVNRIIPKKQGSGVSNLAQETWHSMSPLGTGFNISGNNFNGDATYADYTFEPMGINGSVHLRGNINVTAGPGNAFKALTTAGIPYTPTQPRYFPVSFNTLAQTGSNANGGMAVLETSGNIFVYGGASAAADTCLVFDSVIRLD